MTINIGGDINRLPKWAQRFIERAIRANEDLESKIKAMSEPNKDSRVTWSSGIGQVYGLPDHACVEFHLASGERIDVQYDSEQGCVVVYGFPDSVVILPSAANSFRVTRAPREIL